jgi:hypothetical protein
MLANICDATQHYSLIRTLCSRGYCYRNHGNFQAAADAGLSLFVERLAANKNAM